jgi:hypothetical protein
MEHDYSQEALELVAMRPGFASAIAKLVQQGAARSLPRTQMAMTARQRELLDFIVRFSWDHAGVAPSYQEMCDFMGLASKSGIHRLIVALEERGHIRRLPNRARAIVVSDARLVSRSDDQISKVTD